MDKGVADGLLISCVSSCSNLWALIMDAGTGFSSQVYELSPFFLHKVISELLYCIFEILYFVVMCSRIYFLFPIHRVGLWNSGRRTITLVLLRVPIMEAPL